MREAPSSRVRADADQFIAELGPAVAPAEAQERQGQIAAARGAEALKLAQSMFAAGQLRTPPAAATGCCASPTTGASCSPRATSLRGRVAAGAGDVLGAEAQFRRALELRPSAEIPDPHGPEAAALEAARKTAAPAAGCAWCRRRSARCRPASRRGSTSRSRGTPRRWSRRWSSATARARRGRVPDHARAQAAHAARGRRPGRCPPRRARRLLRPRPRRARRRGGRERRPDAAVPAAGRGAGHRCRPRARRTHRHAWYEHWWVWTIVGAVAIGAGAATYAETRSSGDNLLTLPGHTNQ